MSLPVKPSCSSKLNAWLPPAHPTSSNSAKRTSNPPPSSILLVSCSKHSRAHTPAPKLLINSRADVAVAVEADGVHITTEPGSLTPSDVRRLYASAGLPEPVVSISCHTLAEVARARDAAASMILFGPVFEKVIVEDSTFGAASNQPIDALISEGIGLNLLHIACSAAAPTPVLALGGITPENTAACLAAGAAGIAAIRLFSLAG